MIDLRQICHVVNTATHQASVTLCLTQEKVAHHGSQWATFCSISRNVTLLCVVNSMQPNKCDKTFEGCAASTDWSCLADLRGKQWAAKQVRQNFRRFSSKYSLVVFGWPQRQTVVSQTSATKLSEVL